MYVETKRKTDERDAERFKKRLTKNEQRQRETSKSFLGCFGTMLPIAGVIYFFLRNDPNAFADVALGFVILVAILGWSMMEGPYKERNWILDKQAKLRNGSAIERNIVASRCFEVDNGLPGHFAAKNYYLDIGEQGTLVVDNPSLLNFEVTLIKLFDSDGREFDSFYEGKNERIMPIATFFDEDLKQTPGMEAFPDVKPFTVIAEPFEDLLRRLGETHRVRNPDSNGLN